MEIRTIVGLNGFEIVEVLFQNQERIMVVPRKDRYKSYYVHEDESLCIEGVHVEDGKIIKEGDVSLFPKQNYTSLIRNSFFS